MKIFFDPSIFYLQPTGGISRYVIELYNNLDKNINSKIIAPVYINNFLHHLKTKNKFCILKINKYRKFTRKASIYFNKKTFELYCKINRPNIVHLTYYDTYNNSKKIKNVLTVYDLIHEKFSNKYNFRYPYLYKKKSIDIADRIICISENTKKDLINYYKIDENKISVIYLGCSENKLTQEINDEFLNKPFILYVGDRSKYKNFDNLIIAYSKSQKLKNNLNFVCFGGGKFSEKEIQFFKNHKILNKIKIFEGNDFQLNYLYKYAVVYICPSLYEGFGLTILEAMKMKCPIVSSNRGSLMEVGEDIIDYFDPNDVNDIIFKIEKLVFDDQKKKEMIEKYFGHLNNFTWKKTALLTEKVYRSLI